MRHMIFLCFLIMGCTSKKEIIDSNLSFLHVLKVRSKASECGVYIDNFHEYKKQLIDSLDPLMYRNYPIFLIQEYDNQNGEFYEAIWNKTNSRLEYKKDSRGINTVINFYPHYYYGLIESWDTAKIREYEKKYGNNFGSNRVTGMKVEMKDGKLQISCVNFFSFYLPD